MKNKPRRIDPGTYAEWLKMVNQDPRAWLKHEMDMADPTILKDGIMELLKSGAETTQLLHRISGLAIIADMHGDKDGSNACCDALKVLASAYCTIDHSS